MKKHEDELTLANEFEVPGQVVAPKKPEVYLPPEAELFKGMDPDEAYAKALHLNKQAEVVIKWFTENLKSGLLQSEKFYLTDMNKGNREWAKDATVDNVVFITGYEPEKLMVPATLKSPSVIAKEFGDDVALLLEQSGLITRKTPAKVVKAK